MKIASHIGALLAVSTTLGLGLFGVLFSETLDVLSAERAAASNNLEMKEVRSLEEALKVYFLLADLSAYDTHLIDPVKQQALLIEERIEQMDSQPLAGELGRERALISESTNVVAQMLQNTATIDDVARLEELDEGLDKELVLLRGRCDTFVERMEEGLKKNIGIAEARQDRLQFVGLLGGVLYVCLVILLWRWTAKTVIDPLQELTVEAEKAEDGHQKIAPLSGGPYEVRVLGRAISGLVHSLGHHQEVLETTVKTRTQELVRANEDLLEEIVQRERAEDALREHEEKKREDHKMEALGRLAGGVAHDFNNLLTAIIGYSDLSIGRMQSEDPERENLKQIRHAGERASALTKQLLLLGRKQLNEPVNLSLGTVAANMQKILQSMLGEKVALSLDIGENTPAIEADQGQLEQVLMNLTVNARDAIEDFGTVKITIGSGERDFNGKEQVHLYVEDDGSGMDKETQVQMFEPYFSTKPVDKGTGLGLSIVYGIIQQNHGFIKVDSIVGEGTTMRLYFPATEGAPVNLPSVEDVPMGSEGQRRILLVEDEAVVRSLASSTLEFAGYEVVQASDGVEAIETFTERPEDFDMIVTDVVMPRMGGRELIEEASKLCPKIKVLYLSGHIADEELHAAITKKGVPFLPKPFRPSELTKRVLEVLGES